ncbi:GNAT family N-acetyltransferase, partial [Pseudomonas sp. MWU13-2625]
MSGTPLIRAAQARDVGAILALMRELAEFEKLTHLFVATEADLADALFGTQPAAEARVAEHDGAIVAYALFFHNY